MNQQLGTEVEKQGKANKVNYTQYECVLNDIHALCLLCGGVADQGESFSSRCLCNTALHMTDCNMYMYVHYVMCLYIPLLAYYVAGWLCTQIRRNAPTQCLYAY